MNKFWTYVKSIFIPVAVGAIVGLIQSGANDYEILNKPPLSPPGIVFPIVWTILYILMGISYAILKTNNKIDDKLKKTYYAQLIVNALWSIIFFNFKLRFLAFLWIILLAILVIIMIKEFYKRNKVSGLLQIPYIIWVIFATYLNFGSYILNR